MMVNRRSHPAASCLFRQFQRRSKTHVILPFEPKYFTSPCNRIRSTGGFGGYFISQQIIVAITVYVLQLIKEQLLVVSLFFNLRELTISVVAEEHRIGVAGVVVGRRESNQYIYIAVSVEVVGISLRVSRQVAEKGCLCVISVGFIVKQQFGIITRNKDVLESVTGEVSERDFTSDVYIDPLSVTHVQIDHAVGLIHQVNQSVSIDVHGFGGQDALCWSTTVTTKTA